MWLRMQLPQANHHIPNDVPRKVGTALDASFCVLLDWDLLICICVCYCRCMWMWMCMHMYACVCMCMHVYIYIHMYIYMCVFLINQSIYIYTYIHTHYVYKVSKLFKSSKVVRLSKTVKCFCELCREMKALWLSCWNFAILTAKIQLYPLPTQG